ncbi:nuclear transport factor 2 family protein [Mycobacterium sp. PS03-16]|uniref:nuclear transport factor 2 family protein n=1 Tax=Mycobacterium sp. PS03-16 TaxID=2559611 RepID=UPI00107382B0|nr:nuclear transport factor 2 family protein [Mycobacterium sp. PS03-16]TFV57047.1 nuclear transport factor 2 family protein [Mycobacterium sp. PS03-16]
MASEHTMHTRIAPDALPSAITAYLTAHQARDAATAVATFTDDAVVVDEGHTYRGHQEIVAWLSDAASEFTYTTELTGAATIGAADYDVTQHLEGNFPGGVADLHFRFRLRDGLISHLVIEP